MLCLPKAFCQITGISIEQMLHEIGHDGSEILWPELPEPLCRRAFHVQEIIEVLLKHGHMVTPIEKYPSIQPYNGREFVGDEAPLPPRDFGLYKDKVGVVIGIYNGVGHAFKWINGVLECPNGGSAFWVRFDARILYIVKTVSLTF